MGAGDENGDCGMKSTLRSLFFLILSTAIIMLCVDYSCFLLRNEIGIWR